MVFWAYVEEMAFMNFSWFDVFTFNAKIDLAVIRQGWLSLNGRGLWIIFDMA